ncbi:MAG TPA: MMPL family transporter [Kofleriaceae bacterium]
MRTARHYVAWIRRNALAIIAVHLALVAIAVWLVATRLPLKSDFSYLLPPDAPAVKDLRKLEARVAEGDSVLVVMRAPSSAEREAAANELVVSVKKIAPDLVEEVATDDAEIRAFLEAHRHLFVPLADLQKAEAALKRRIESAKLAANPLFISIDEPDAAQVEADKKQLEDLRVKRKEAEEKLHRPSNVTPDGTTTSIQVRTPFRATDAGKGKRLLHALQDVRAQVIATHPRVEIGITGGIVTSVAEHDAILDGMLLSSIITGLLVALVLALYFRSAKLLVLLLAMLGIAVIIAFGLAALTVGHLNAATAFLGAIIAGNGVNYGILLIARYLEERRHAEIEASLAVAIVATLRPTLIASLGAAIAYGSLAATSFRGFADFAIIGAVGMIVCWIATYLLLPALMLRFGKKTRIVDADPLIGRALVRLIGFRNSALVVGASLLLAAAASVVVVRYIKADPFEYDMTHLRSIGDDAVTARKWMSVSDKAFGRGITGRTFIAVDRYEQVPLIVEALTSRNAALPPDKQTIGSVSSILDVLPPDQPAKLQVLADLRTLLDDDALDALEAAERNELRELRPPDDLAIITRDNLPPALKKRLVEKNGTVGLLLSIRPAPALDEWNGKDLVRFADAVRSIELPDHEIVTTSGSSVVFADILHAIEKDGPRVTSVAAIGLVIMVLLLVGPNRRAFAVLVGTAGGSLFMVATCALLGLKVNFLDFVALPITLGLGIDYAINVAHRHAAEELHDPLLTLRTSGSAVFICSLTTIIGYGSLLASKNLAIRGFGTSALIGEVSCVLCALIVVPAILALGRRR